MSDDLGGFALPPFNADNALVQIKRSLRDLKLAERGNRLELRGKPVVDLALEGATVSAKLARKLAMTPQWDAHPVRNAADQRKLLDEVKKRLARWDQED
jgi:hypothetical protein